MSDKQNKSSETKNESLKNKETSVIENINFNIGNAVDDIKNFITEYDIYLFREGKHFSLHEKLGAHVIEYNNTRGTFFAVWAPNAASVSVIGNFNGWLKDANHLDPREDDSGLWEGFIPGVEKGEAYKYFIRSKFDGFEVEKADPVGFYSEQPPKMGIQLQLE
jgi:1,4-alpha-glucan branching enzyme